MSTDPMAELTEREASGMTVNERLVVAGLIGAFDDAVARKDEAELRRILARVFLDDANMDAIVRRVLPGS